MLIDKRDFSLLAKVLPEGAKGNLPLLEMALKSGVPNIEMSSGIVAKLLEVLTRIHPEAVHPEQRSKFLQLVRRLRDEDTRQKTLGVEEPKLPALQELEKALAGRSLSSESELRDFMATWNQSVNELPQHNLGNLTPTQMEHLFRNGWWAETAPIKLATNLPLEETTAVPLVHNVQLLLATLLRQSVNGRLKATVTGRLPRSVIAALLPDLADPENTDLINAKRMKNVNDGDLHSFRWQSELARFAGLTVLKRGFWSVTALGKKLSDPRESSTLLIHLFDRAFHGFDLSLIDGYERIPAFEFLLPYFLWRLSTLPQGRVFEPAVLSAEVLHPRFRQMFSRPLYEGSKRQFSDFFAELRLFRPLLLLGCLSATGLMSFSETLTFQVCPFFSKLFQAPGLRSPADMAIQC